jgi:Asp-tRNA(Asn)/Glu-tRNA(Gln) amidotransferase B subunit
MWRLLINRIDDQTISGKIGKSIFEEMCSSVSQLQMKLLNLKACNKSSDDGAIEEDYYDCN